MNKTKETLHPEILKAIQRALQEDIQSGDVTSNSIIPPEAMMCGEIIAKQVGTVAGLDVTQACFHLVDESIIFTAHASEGESVQNRQLLATLEGPARALLTAERTALNFLGRMSGIATLTHQFVDAVAGTNAVILDTRKTAPGLRMVDKLAVVRGGGQNHRFGLYDMILIKDNHIDFAGSLEEAVRQARAARSGLQVEVEARNVEDVCKGIALGVDRILLDNMTLKEMSESVQLSAGRVKLEASGNVILETVRKIAETGVDYISSGALTHSAKVFDVSLKWVAW